MDQGISDEGEPRDEEHHQPDPEWACRVERGRSIGLVGQDGQDQQGEDREFHGCVDILRIEALGEFAGLWFESEQSGGGHPDTGGQHGLTKEGKTASEEDHESRNLRGLAEVTVPSGGSPVADKNECTDQ